MDELLKALKEAENDAKELEKSMNVAFFFVIISSHQPIHTLGNDVNL